MSDNVSRAELKEFWAGWLEVNREADHAEPLGPVGFP